MARIQVLDPRAQPRTVEARPLPALDTLRDRVVAILNNGWTSMDLIATQLDHELRTRHGVADVIHQSIPLASQAPAALIDDLAQRADAVIVGLAN